MHAGVWRGLAKSLTAPACGRPAFLPGVVGRPLQTVAPREALPLHAPALSKNNSDILCDGAQFIPQRVPFPNLVLVFGWSVTSQPRRPAFVPWLMMRQFNCVGLMPTASCGQHPTAPTGVHGRTRTVPSTVALMSVLPSGAPSVRTSSVRFRRANDKFLRRGERNSRWRFCQSNKQPLPAVGGRDVRMGKSIGLDRELGLVRPTAIALALLRVGTES